MKETVNVKRNPVKMANPNKSALEKPPSEPENRAKLQIQTENVDEVRKLVAEEGRSARNLLVWNVPVEPTSGIGSEGHNRSPLSPRSMASKPPLSPRESEKAKIVLDQKSRIRSASAERDPKMDLRARYWAFLFDNLSRAVDEIYTTCESNENIAECKEVIMILENFTKEFSALIDWIKLKTDYENTLPLNRPHSLAWEVRKSSPIKMRLFSTSKNVLNPRVARCLNFEEKPTSSVSVFDKSIQTERVHGLVTSPAKTEVPQSNGEAGQQHHVPSAANTAVPKAEAKTSTKSNWTTNSPKTTMTTIGVPKPAIRTACGVQGLARTNQLTNKLRSGQVLSSSDGKPNRVTNAKQPPVSRVTGPFTNHQNKPIISSYHASQAAGITADSANRSRLLNKKDISKETNHVGSNSSLSSSSSSSRSWADKVKGHVEIPPADQEAEDDSEGWETVQRPRFRSRTSPPFKMNKNISQAKINSSQQFGLKNQYSTTSKSQQRLSSNSAGHLRMALKTDSAQSLPALHLKIPSAKNSVPESDVKPHSGQTALCKRASSYPSISMNVENVTKSSKSDELQVKELKEVKEIQANSIDEKSQPLAGDCNEKDKSCENCLCKPVTPKPQESSSSQCLTPILSNIAEVNDAESLKISDVQEKPENVSNVDDEILESKEPLAASVEFNSSDDSELTQQLSPDFMLDVEGRNVDDDTRSPLDDELQCAIEQEKNLTKQIEEARKSGPDLDGCHTSSETDQDATTPEGIMASMADWHMFHQEMEERLGHNLANMPWGDRMDQIEAEMRLPGRALHMHEKLSSPSRKRSLSESIRRHEERQAKAQELRERLLEEKSQKLRELSKKVEEVRTWKNSLLNQRRNIMKNKLQRAEEKRRLQLQKIVKKAHDEEEKVNEIAFINTLEAQNKRHDVLTRFQGFEARRLDIQEERQRKQEEKAAKEAAAEERRRVLEAERQARLVEIQEKRKQKEHKIEQQLQEKEKERQEQAREKARDREERLSALHAAQQATAEELHKKIQQKQEESARRHEENIEHKRQKALELSIMRSSSTSDEAPRLVPYDTKKFCTLCNVLIGSEVYLLSHLRGKKHQQSVKEEHEGNEPSREELEKYNLKHIIDAPADKLDPEVALDKERQKALKKRCKKLRHRMIARGVEYERSLKPTSVPESPFKARITRCIRDITKLCQVSSVGSISHNSSTTLERSLNEINKILEKQNEADLSSFRFHGGFTALTTLLGKICEEISDENANGLISQKVFVSACKVYSLAFASENNCGYALGSNKLGELVELLSRHLNWMPSEKSAPSPATGSSPACHLPGDPAAAAALLNVLATALNHLPTLARAQPLHLHDVISYVVSVGVVDRLSVYFNGIRGPIDDGEPLVCDFLLQGTRTVASLTRLLTDRRGRVFSSGRPASAAADADPTQLVATLRVTGLAGTVSLLYAMLLPSGTPSRGDGPPPPLAARPLAVATSCLLVLNRIAVLDLRMFQGVMGDEGLSLEFRHIAGYLLWYCSHHAQQKELLHEVLLLVGYFTVLNADNQMMIQSGHPPSVLQQLCALPFHYFSNPALVEVLFPTLIACCFANAHNKAVLEQEMSCQLLATFLQERQKAEASRIRPPSSDASPSLAEDTERWQLRVRFPVTEWSEAALFFSDALTSA